MGDPGRQARSRPQDTRRGDRQAPASPWPEPQDWRQNMISGDVQAGLLHRLNEIRRLCPEMRLGQLMATLGVLGEDETDRSLWDLEDEELAAAIERFADDLARRVRD